MTTLEGAAKTVAVGDRVRLMRTIYRDTDLCDLIASAGELASVTARRGQVLVLAGAFKDFEVDASWVEPV